MNSSHSYSQNKKHTLNPSPTFYKRAWAQPFRDQNVPGKNRHKKHVKKSSKLKNWSSSAVAQNDAEQFAFEIKIHP